MPKIMFVCHGNICRSPMAEYLFKELLKERGEIDKYTVKSSATSYEEIGNPVYPPAKKILNEHGINCDGKVSEKLVKEDYEKYDYFIVMDEKNKRWAEMIFQEDGAKKIYKLMSFTEEERDVSDPYFTGDFEATYSDIEKGIKGLYEFLKNV